MKEIHFDEIKKTVCDLFIFANYNLSENTKNSISCAIDNEKKPVAKDILCKLIENITVSKENNIPICQDTGMAIVFLEIGQDVHITGGYINDAINAGVEKAYVDGYLRKSIVNDPLNRVNTNTNTPAIIHVEIVQGDNLAITVCPKGFGSENMSAIKMFNPTASKDEIEDFVVNTVLIAGANPCPPIILGIGIGGDFEYAPYLAKKALTFDTCVKNENIFYSKMEEDILLKINSLDIGPQGFGGNTTALGVNILTFPTHIAGLPVAVNISCHVSRHASCIL